MKNFKLFKRLLLVALLIIMNAHAYAGEIYFCGDYGSLSDPVFLYYSKNGGSGTKLVVAGNGQSDLSLGTVSSLVIQQFRAVTKAHDARVCAVYLVYGINTSRDGTKNNSIKALHNTSGYSDWTWDSYWGVQQFKNASVDLEVLTGLAPGNYYFDYYFTMEGNTDNSENCYANCGYWSNNSGNYHMSFTVPSKTLTVQVNGTANGNSVTGGLSGVSIGTEYTITATPVAGYKFNGWTATSGGSNITIADASSATTTVTFNKLADVTVKATFVPTYGFIEGRFKVKDATRSTTTYTKENGQWQTTSNAIKMDKDNTNHRFYKHTYCTPAQLAELIGTQTGEGEKNPYFFVSASTASNSVTSPLEYWATSNESNNDKLLAAGTAGRKAVRNTSGYAFTFMGNSTSTGYAIIYSDKDYIWYELEHDINYNANGGSGDAPTPVYFNNGTEATVAANSTYSKSGYKFKWWNTNSGGTGEDFFPGEKFTISANTDLYAQWEPVTSGWAYWNGNTAASSSTLDVTGNGVTMRLTKNSVDYNTGIQNATVVSKYSGTEKHANVLAMDAANEYLQVHFTDGSPINALQLGTVHNETSGTKKVVVIYSTTADFSTGEHEEIEVTIPHSNQASKSVTSFSPSTSNKYLYARIYKSVSTAVYSYTGPASGGAGKMRIYSIKAQKGTACGPNGLAYETATVNKTYGDAAFTNTLTNAHSLAVSYSSGDDDVATVNSSNGQVTIKGAGSTTITATWAGNVTYCAGSVDYTLNVAKADITPSVSYASVGGTTLTVGETSSGSPTISGNPGDGTVTYSSSDPSVASVDENTGVVTAEAAGTATITATIAATANYNGNTTTAEFTINAACSATQPGTISKGTASGGTGSITLTADGSPASNNTWYWQASADGTSTSVSGATKNVSAAGTYYIRSYCSDGSGCWSDARSVTVDASDLLTPITPSLSYASTVTYGSTINPTLTGNAGSGTVTYSLNDVTPAGSLTINSSTGAVTGATASGTATVTATIAAKGNYAGGSAISETITVTTAALPGTASTGTATSVTHNSASLPFTITDITGVASITIKVYNGASVAKTYSGITPATSGSYSATGLSESTTYTYTITLIGDANHNDKAETSKSTSFTTSAEPTLTALVDGTLYKANGIFSGDIPTSDTYVGGISDNGKFFFEGSASASPHNSMKWKEFSATLNEIDFAAIIYFDGESALSSNNPTTRAMKFILPSAGTLTIYYRDNNTGAGKVKLNKSGSEPTWSSTTKGNSYATTSELSAGTYYLYATAGSTGIFGVQFDATAATYTVSASVDPAGYGTLSASSITDVTSGTAISASSNVLTVGASSITATPAATTAQYTYAFNNWTWTPAGETVTSDVTATANFTRTPVNYTLTWDVNGGVAGSCSGCTTGTVAYGTTLVAPSDPTRDGYDFAGWSPTPAATMPAANTTYTATWTLATYSITYDLHDGGAGSLDGEKTSYQITDEDYDLPTPEWTGHTFLGWYATYSAGVYSDPVSVLTSGSTGNKTYHAKWADGVEIVWTITKVDSKLYKGGTGYSVKAVVNNTSWTGHDNLVLSASDGVTLGTPTKSTVDSKAQIVADFSISGSLAEDAITFSLYAPATGVYAAIEDEKEVELDDCPSAGGESTEITLSWFDKDQTSHDSKTNKPSSETKWFYGYTNSAKTRAYAYTMTTSCTDNKDKANNNTLTMKYGGTNVFIYADSTGTTGTPAEFKKVTAISLDIKLNNIAGQSNTFTIKVGSTTVANAVSLSEASTSDWKTYSYSGLSNLDGVIEIINNTGGGGSTNYNIFIDNIAITHTPPTTPAGVATSLAWSDDDATDGTVNKNDNDGDFQIYASPTPANAGGTITYNSSNTSVATVSSDGTVHIVNDGSTTITASMSAYGCYSPAEPITYSLVVANTCADTPGTIVNNDGSAIAGNAVNRGACETLTLKLTGHSGSTIQWKKDGVDIPSANAATYFVPTGESGVYSATVEGSCTLSSTNSITVTTAGVPEPTIFADDFYVKSGKWFGYRLMQINRGETVTVKTAPTGWTEDTDFSITTDASGIVSISGRKTISTPANKILTLTIANECGGSVDKNITIREMADTAKPTIAWIATNNKGGSGQKDNVKADESTNTDLYDYLKDDYIITPRNCYWTTNEADLVKEYSQYDLIILTDYPNSGTCPSGKSGKSNSYTNAIGLLIDHKPIMTFEAFVAGCPNWGIASDPQNTKATQTDLTLLCNADEIFGTRGKFGAGQAIRVTSASSGQALQGFPVASSPDFVFIGKITDSDEKTYVACCERQHEIAARMMVFGLNSSIMSSLTADGKTMVEGFIEYLLKDDPASVPDCSVIFNGGGGDNSWYTTSNWEAGLLPDQYASVRIDAPCVVPENANPAKAGGIKIHVGDAFNGSLTIEPAGRMIVEKTITRIEGNAYTIHMPTEPEDLIIQSGETAQGALIFDNESGTTQATVGMYSKGRYYDGVYNWQYVAVPLVSASRWNMGDWAYCFDNSIGNWTGNDVCPAFSAVGVTRMDDELPTYEFSGPLASTKNQTLTLYTSAAGNDGYNMIGNSWTAPIQIVNFQPGDFGTARYQVNIYNTGHDPEDGPAVEESKDQQGRWKTIPIAAAQAAIDAGTWADLKVIPSMQAFEVQNETGANTTLTLNYDRLVRTLPTEPNLNETKRTPRRTPVERTAVPQMRITLKDETTRENLYLFSGEQFSEGFDNGWDGVYNAGEAGYMQIYMLSPIGNLEISAQPEMEGTTFGFTAGSREVYTFSFKYVGNEELYFNDLKEKKSTLINDENEYTFTAQEGENGIRFMISATPYNSQQITTGMTDLDAEAPQAQKVIYNDKLYIIRGGKVFSADGHLVK